MQPDVISLCKRIWFTENQEDSCNRGNVKSDQVRKLQTLWKDPSIYSAWNLINTAELTICDHLIRRRLKPLEYVSVSAQMYQNSLKSVLKEYSSICKHWFTIFFLLEERCRKAMLGVWVLSCTSKVMCFVLTDEVKLLLNRCYSRHSRIFHLPAFGEDGKGKTTEVHCVKSDKVLRFISPNIIERHG